MGHARGAGACRAAFRERLLLVVLFITVLASSIAFIEPSPHDALMAVLLVVALIAGVRLERILLVPFLLLLIWNFAGMMALLHVPGLEKTIQYTGTSIYLAIAALLFAVPVCQEHHGAARHHAGRLHHHRGHRRVYRHGRLFPCFRDRPPVHAARPRAWRLQGPERFRAVPDLAGFVPARPDGRAAYRFTDAIVAGIILFGLLLSFSRGAWFHFAVSCLVMIALAFVTAPTPRVRLRVLALSATAVVALALFMLFLLSFEAIADMFKERAHLIQSYDVGSGGRFRLQELALTSVLKFPNGMGPFEFARVHGLQQHNVYLQAFLVYGWTGGMAYLLLLFSTVMVGLRTALMRTPWQPYLITALAAFVGEMAEGFVIDTDHWRHFYLMLGMVWGLAAATFRQTAWRQCASRRLGGRNRVLTSAIQTISCRAGSVDAGRRPACARFRSP